MIPFNKRLRTLRELLGLSQEQLAELSGVPQHTISACERGIPAKLPNAILLHNTLNQEALKQNITLPWLLIELETA